MASEGVTLEPAGEDTGLLRFVSGRPGNAVTQRLLELFAGRVREVEASGLRALVVAGSSEHFAGGADVAEMATLDEHSFRAYVELEFALFRAVEQLALPTVAAISGACAGTGAELALVCDLRVAGRSARMSFPEARIGFPGPAGRLSRFVGLGRAKDILLSGRGIPADEALAMGLVTQVVDDGEVEGAAAALAARLARVPASGVSLTKALVADVYRMADVPEHQMLAWAVEAFQRPELKQAIARAAAGAS